MSFGQSQMREGYNEVGHFSLAWRSSGYDLDVSLLFIVSERRLGQKDMWIERMGAFLVRCRSLHEFYIITFGVVYCSSGYKFCQKGNAKHSPQTKSLSTSPKERYESGSYHPIFRK